MEKSPVSDRTHKVNDYLTWQDGPRLRRGRVVGWCDDRRVYIVEDTAWTPRQPGCGWVLVPYERSTHGQVD